MGEVGDLLGPSKSGTLKERNFMKWSRDHVLTSDLNAGTWGLWHGL
jgi:hypothetical protein